MSVLADNRKESRFEPITFSETIHDMLTELIQHNFGIKDMDAVVRRQYRAGKCEPNDYWKYMYLLRNYKVRIDSKASELTSFVRDAYARYPSSMERLEKRRELQDCAVSMCWQIVMELQHVVEKFNVDLNLYKRQVQALCREIELIKKWRQRDNKFETYLRGNN